MHLSKHLNCRFSIAESIDIVMQLILRTFHFAKVKPCPLNNSLFPPPFSLATTILSASMSLTVLDTSESGLTHVL